MAKHLDAERLDYVGAIRRDSRGIVEAARAAGPDAGVRCCPDWTVADLVWHLRRVHYFWGTIVADRLQNPGGVPDIDRPSDFEALLDDFAAGADRLSAILSDVDPATVVWTWASQQDAAFVMRHQAEETVVHRWDAEDAAGRTFAIDPPLAADAVDEFLEFMTGEPAKDAAPVGGTVHLHATDADGEWVVSEKDQGGLDVRREHAKADVAARATASDLLLMLYRRVGPDRAEVFGDRGVLERFLARWNLS